MSLSILNNISALEAENQLNITTQAANASLQQLSSGSRINSGADDAAGLAISDGLNANVAALNQSSQNVTDGVGLLQTADGALSQITALLNRAVTLATEASNSTAAPQINAINSEYKAIQGEINNINTSTAYNGSAIFGQTFTAAVGTAAAVNTPATFSVFTSDGKNNTTFLISVSDASAAALSLTTSGFTTTAGAQAELGYITSAISLISAQRGELGANVEQLQAASAVDTTESQNLASASSDITSADIGATVANDTKYSVLEQTGISALQQANQQSQTVLKLLQ